jgi:protein-disulfide isomerase
MTCETLLPFSYFQWRHNTMAKKNKRANARKRKGSREQQKKQQQQIQIGAALIGILVIGLIAFFSLGGESAPEVAQARLDLDPILGNPNAPVTVTEYSAYGCPSCRAWHQAGVMDQILEEFPNQVKFIYRDIPIIIPAWDQQMAEVAQCALDQGQDAFWKMNNALFTLTNQGGTSQAEAVQYGVALGLDVGVLRACVDNKTHTNTVRYDMQRAEARGIRGTPTWFVNGQQVFNASPDILRQMISSELTRLGG